CTSTDPAPALSPIEARVIAALEDRSLPPYRRDGVASGLIKQGHCEPVTLAALKRTMLDTSDVDVVRAGAAEAYGWLAGKTDQWADAVAALRSAVDGATRDSGLRWRGTKTVAYVLARHRGKAPPPVV